MWTWVGGGSSFFSPHPPSPPLLSEREIARRPFPLSPVPPLPSAARGSSSHTKTCMISSSLGNISRRFLCRESLERPGVGIELRGIDCTSNSMSSVVVVVVSSHVFSFFPVFTHLAASVLDLLAVAAGFSAPRRMLAHEEYEVEAESSILGFLREGETKMCGRAATATTQQAFGAGDADGTQTRVLSLSSVFWLIPLACH